MKHKWFLRFGMMLLCGGAIAHRAGYSIAGPLFGLSMILCLGFIVMEVRQSIKRQLPFIGASPTGGGPPYVVGSVCAGHRDTDAPPHPHDGRQCRQCELVRGWHVAGLCHAWRRLGPSKGTVSLVAGARDDPSGAARALREYCLVARPNAAGGDHIRQDGGVVGL